MVNLRCFEQSRGFYVPTFAEWLIAERAKRGWNPTDLARETGIQQPLIVMYENGKRAPKRNRILHIAKVMGTDPSPALIARGLLPESPEPVEVAVLSLLQTLLNAMPTLPAAKKAKTTRRRQRTAMEVQQEMSELVRMKLSGRIRPSVYEENYDRLEAELTALDREDVSAQAEQYTLTQAQEALTTGDMRSICLHLVRRAEAPVFVEGVEYIGGKAEGYRYGNGTPRRCVRVTTTLSFGGEREWIAPIYRGRYTGEREVYRADGTRL